MNGFVATILLGYMSIFCGIVLFGLTSQHLLFFAGPVAAGAIVSFLYVR
jgi:hypothetical protein